MIDYALKAEKFVGDKEIKDLMQDEMLLFAVARALEVIGEASKQVPVSLKDQYLQVELKVNGCTCSTPSSSSLIPCAKATLQHPGVAVCENLQRHDPEGRVYVRAAVNGHFPAPGDRVHPPHKVSQGDAHRSRNVPAGARKSSIYVRLTDVSFSDVKDSKGDIRAGTVRTARRIFSIMMIHISLFNNVALF